LAILKEARRVNPSVTILVRTRDDSDFAELKAAGASEVVPELLESSLMLAAHALVLLGYPGQQVEERVDQVRRDRYRLLHGFYPGAEDDEA
jgi:CPA2 family monovalent cation:H+ antiporter-2